MSFIGSMFGVKGANIDRPTTVGQAQTSYDQTQQGLQGQQDFLRQLQGQGGLANQSSVFGQQQGLADLMKGVATGTGPNPALAQLEQTTGKNIAATTAAMAGARGAGSNPALMARSAARQGAETQQEAVGQGATLAAQQQIAGMDALARQQQAMGSMANQQVANQAAATNAYSTSAQNQQQNILASINAQNQAEVAMRSNMNNANASLGSSLIGGLTGGAGAAMTAMGATGGAVRRGNIGHNISLADGGVIDPGQIVQRADPLSIDGGGGGMGAQLMDLGGTDSLEKGMRDFGKGLGSAMKDKKKPTLKTGPSEELPAANFKKSKPASFGDTNFTMMAAKGGKVPALVSPGEKYLDPEQAQDVLKGKENPMNGKTIPGKAKVKGDSYDNDTVPVTLEEGGCVIPRSVLQSDQPMKNAIKFVHAHMKKMAKGGKVENKKQEHKEEHKEQPAHEAVPMAVASQVLNNPHVLFSPANALYDKELDMTPDEVLDMLKKNGLVAEAAIGKYGDVEPSIMVHNVEHKHVPFLFNLAKKLGQESAIYSAGGKHEAHYLNGPNTGKVARGMGTALHEKEPENFYTKTKNGLIFSHDIDWDNLHDR